MSPGVMSGGELREYDSAKGAAETPHASPAEGRASHQVCIFVVRRFKQAPPPPVGGVATREFAAARSSSPYLDGRAADHFITKNRNRPAERERLRDLVILEDTTSCGRSQGDRLEIRMSLSRIGAFAIPLKSGPGSDQERIHGCERQGSAAPQSKSVLVW